MDLDTSRWSGEGEFTQLLAEAISKVEHVLFLRVEDAPSTRSEADYNFVSNEVYVRFETNRRVEYVRWFGFLPGMRHVRENVLKTVSYTHLRAHETLRYLVCRHLLE